MVDRRGAQAVFTIALRRINVRHSSQQLLELARPEHEACHAARAASRWGADFLDVAQKFELTARTREVNPHIDVPGPLPLINAERR